MEDHESRGPEDRYQDLSAEAVDVLLGVGQRLKLVLERRELR